MKNNIDELNISRRELEELNKVSKNIKKDYKKLLSGYPIQYLIGYSSFYGYKFLINKSTLIPRFETELLVEKTIKYIKKYLKENIKIIDLGTGSGCIAITLCKELSLKSNVEGVDISLRALKAANKNNKINDTNVKFYKHDILKELQGTYDVIISNPPYVSKDETVEKNVKKYEPKKALYAKDNGLYFFKKIIEASVNHISKKSIIAFEIGCTQAESIKGIAHHYYPKSKILIEKDFSGKDRYLFIFIDK